MKKPGLWAFLLIAGCMVGIYCGSATSPDIETYAVTRGSFTSTVTETGELEAVKSENINSPSISWRFGAMKIIQLVEEGKQVKQGDVLVEFDKTEVMKSIDDAKAELEIAKAELRKAKATNQSKIEELEFELQKSDLQHQISKLKLEQAGFEAEIDRKKIELDLEKATITLDKARQEIENQKKVNKEEESKLELRVKQVETKLVEAQESLEKLTIKAPSDGIAIIKKSWMTDEKYQVDDQVYSGWPMVGLPDLSLMQAKVEVNEVDIAKIDTLQKARIRMDAYPDTSFAAEVQDVATLARNKERDSKIKVFDVTVVLTENDTTLMPGMTVSCEIIVDTIGDTLFIPLEALYKKDGENIVYVKNGSGFDARKVDIGQENNDFVIIASGLREGEQVALTDPTVLQKEKSASGSKKKGGKKA